MWNTVVVQTDKSVNWPQTHGLGLPLHSPHHLLGRSPAPSVNANPSELSELRPVKLQISVIIRRIPETIISRPWTIGSYAASIRRFNVGGKNWRSISNRAVPANANRIVFTFNFGHARLPYQHPMSTQGPRPRSRHRHLPKVHGVVCYALYSCCPMRGEASDESIAGYCSDHQERNEVRSQRSAEEILIKRTYSS